MRIAAVGDVHLGEDSRGLLRPALEHLAGTADVLLLAGEVDLNSPPRSVAEFARLFPDASLVVQPEAGHYPWLDDADRFVTAVSDFLEAADRRP